MAFSWQEEVVPAGTTDLNVNIEYLDKSYINVYLDQVLTTDYYWVSDSLLRLNSAVAVSTTVTIVRRTDKEFLYIKFADGAAFIKENLDTQNTQFLHLAQEMVEGRSIDGFYGDLSMNGYRITNLGAPVDVHDAVPKWVTDALDARTTLLETSFIGNDRIVEWYTSTLESTDIVKPPYQFQAARVFINGAAQPQDYAFVVVDSTIMFAEELPKGTMVHVFLGSPEVLPSEYVTTAEYASVVAGLNSDVADLNSDVAGIASRVAVNESAIAQKAAAGANSDITSLLGLSTALTVAQGGTGATTAAEARTNLGLSSLSLAGTAATGTADTAAFSADTTLTFSAAYSQAEHTTAAAWIKRIAQRVLLLENAIRNNSIQKV